MNLLKRCPFCGGDFLVEYPEDDCVICKDCGTNGPSLTEDGVAAWNDRQRGTDKWIVNAVKAERERCVAAIQSKIDTLGIVMESMTAVGGYSDAIRLGQIKVVAMQEAIDAILGYGVLAAQEGGE